MACWEYNMMEHETVSVGSLLKCGYNVNFIQAPLTVEVLLLEEFIMVPGAERCRCLCVFADNTGVVRGICYKPPEFQQGDTVTLYNYNIEDERVIYHKITSSVRVMKSMIIPPIFIDAAQKMMYSPVKVPMFIKSIKNLPVFTKTKVTFKGKILRIDGPKIIYPAHGETYLKELTCADITGTVQVCLWNYCSERDFKCGQTICVKDGRTRFNNYYKEMTVSINHHDEIKVLPY